MWEAFGDSNGALRLLSSHQAALLGTGGALRWELPLLQSDPVLILNGDSFCDADLGAFWAWHTSRCAGATLLLTTMPDTNRFGRVRVATGGQVLRFEEKAGKEGPDWINAGTNLVKRGLLETIPPGSLVFLEHHVFPAWIDRSPYGYRSQGRFLDIGAPEA